MRPSTKKRDEDVYARWERGDEPKTIQGEMSLTKDEYYKAITREKRRRNGQPVYRRKRAKMG